MAAVLGELGDNVSRNDGAFGFGNAGTGYDDPILLEPASQIASPKRTSNPGPSKMSQLQLSTHIGTFPQTPHRRNSP